jgi:very-short-patch-repair endonuclease
MRFERENKEPSRTGQARSLRRRMTWTEEHLWPELRKLKANFRRQAPIGRYFADFATHNPKLVVEIDGGVHERLPDVALRDFERQQWLESQGGVASELTVGREWAPTPNGGLIPIDVRTPPSPALPPSRRKGEVS